MSFALGSLAFAICALGVGLLRDSWQRRYAGNLRPRALRIVSGWLALFAAAPVWAVAAGPGRGIALTLLATGLLGIALVIGPSPASPNARRRRRRAREPATEPAPPESGLAHGRRLLRGLAVFALAGPVAGTAAYLLAVPLYALLEAAAASGPDRIAVLVFFVPLVWAALAVVATFDMQLARRAAWVGAMAVAGALGTLLVGA